ELKSEAANLKVFQDKSYTTDLIEEFYVNEDYFVVQKFIPGYNFFDLKNIDIEKNVIINNIIDIINDIHAEGYLAVDISPTNFILDDFGRVRLIDLENFTNKNNTVRRAATKFMINTDCPSKICTIQQDYFALAMLSFAIMREHVLIFEGNQNKGNVYLNGCSILFGSSGYLWVLLEFYKKITSNNPSRELIIDKIRDIYKDLISSYQKVEVFDFALGKSGILLSLMKYCINFNDVDSMEFIREKIEELYLYFVDEIRNVNSLKECNFAHGLAGIAYVILIYNSEFEFKVAYENSIKVFNNLLENLLENEYSRLNATPTNLELSWCEGTSGILLYFELLYDKRYSNIISRFQQLAFKFNLIQSSCYCHGLSSLLQTLNYQDKLNLRENVIEILLSRSKRDKNGILVFECEESSDTLFDFGIGNLGIYWSILGERFPFELKKEL
ncbi:lanthionine synthetase LanC family protein, partial [Streptococcus pneumoniae]|uniref:lanthionine synthetase LanC family protein n=1 Tax=Streptococcus pneumoniae TaxID=1313 RepID=UPI000B000A5C